MSITFDSSVSEINYNGSPVTEVIWNTTSVWSSFEEEVLFSGSQSIYGLATDNTSVKYRMEFPLGSHAIPQQGSSYHFRLKQAHVMTKFSFDSLSVLFKLQDGTYTSMVSPDVGANFNSLGLNIAYQAVAPAEVGKPTLQTYSTSVFEAGLILPSVSNPIVTVVVVGDIGGQKDSEHTSTTIFLDIANYEATW